MAPTTSGSGSIGTGGGRRMSLFTVPASSARLAAAAELVRAYCPKDNAAPRWQASTGSLTHVAAAPASSADSNNICKESATPDGRVDRTCAVAGGTPSGTPSGTPGGGDSGGAGPARTRRMTMPAYAHSEYAASASAAVGGGSSRRAHPHHPHAKRLSVPSVAPCKAAPMSSAPGASASSTIGSAATPRGRSRRSSMSTCASSSARAGARIAALVEARSAGTRLGSGASKSTSSSFAASNNSNSYASRASGSSGSDLNSFSTISSGSSLASSASLSRSSVAKGSLASGRSSATSLRRPSVIGGRAIPTGISDGDDDDGEGIEYSSSNADSELEDQFVPLPPKPPFNPVPIPETPLERNMRYTRPDLDSSVAREPGAESEEGDNGAAGATTTGVTASGKPAFQVSQFDASKAALIMTAEVRRVLTRVATADRTEADLAVLQAYVCGFKGLAGYTRKMLRELCRRVEYERVGEGRVILKEGHRPVSFYCIISGQCAAYHTERFEDSGRTLRRVLRRLTTGDQFGDLALVRGTPRTASIVAQTTCELLRIDKEDFDRVQAVVDGAEGAAKLAFLARTAFMAPPHGMDADEVMRLAALGAVREYARNQVILTEGSDVKSLWFVRRGTVRVVKWVELWRQRVDGLPHDHPLGDAPLAATAAAGKKGKLGAYSAKARVITKHEVEGSDCDGAASEPVRLQLRGCARTRDPERVSTGPGLPLPPSPSISHVPCGSLPPSSSSHKQEDGNGRKGSPPPVRRRDAIAAPKYMTWQLNRRNSPLVDTDRGDRVLGKFLVVATLRPGDFFEEQSVLVQPAVAYSGIGSGGSLAALAMRSSMRNVGLSASTHSLGAGGRPLGSTAALSASRRVVDAKAVFKAHATYVANEPVELVEFANVAFLKAASDHTLQVMQTIINMRPPVDTIVHDYLVGRAYRLVRKRVVRDVLEHAGKLDADRVAGRPGRCPGG